MARKILTFSVFFCLLANLLAVQTYRMGILSHLLEHHVTDHEHSHTAAHSPEHAHSHGDAENPEEPLAASDGAPGRCFTQECPDPSKGTSGHRHETRTASDNIILQKLLSNEPESPDSRRSSLGLSRDNLAPVEICAGLFRPPRYS